MPSLSRAEGEAADQANPRGARGGPRAALLSRLSREVAVEL